MNGAVKEILKWGRGDRAHEQMEYTYMYTPMRELHVTSGMNRRRSSHRHKCIHDRATFVYAQLPIRTQT